MAEPVALDDGLTLRCAADDDGASPLGSKGVVVDVHPAAGYVRAVLAVAASVHVEAVAEGAAEFDVVPRLVAGTATSSTGNGVAVGGEQIALDKRFGNVV